jgi:hypothetical protein
MKEHDPLEIHLLQFSTGQTHPSARVRSLYVSKASNYNGRPGISLEVAGDHLAMLATHNRDFRPVNDLFKMFNWKTGELTTVRTGVMCRHLSIR